MLSSLRPTRLPHQVKRHSPKRTSAYCVRTVRASSSADWASYAGPRVFAREDAMIGIETARETMTAYLEALIARGAYEQFFAPDASLTLMGTDQEAHGRDQVAGMIRYLHEQAFDAHPQVKVCL